jgi:arginyl-tRNA--protein-N-Asp/Glu arginylyltransferase
MNMEFKILDRDPPEYLVHDELSDCPYVPGREARLPLRMPVRRLRRSEFAKRLAEGDRRQGPLLYRPKCPDCRACEAIRIPVAEFRPNRSQRRAWKKGRDRIRVQVGPPSLSPELVDLYNRHLEGRNLEVSGPIDLQGYSSFLVESCVDSLEIRYSIEGQLVAVAILDRAEDSLSAVYTYFDPDLSRLSLGVFSVLTEMELCRTLGLRWLYLGLHVADCRAMQYKARFLPHERLIDDRWQRFDRAQGKGV